MTVARLATRAVRAAMRLRADAGICPADALCPFDLSIGLGLSVRIVAVPSLEGMYAPGNPPTILVSSERPVGRRRYTCAHELGHHMFGHGTVLDELDDSAETRWSPEEFLAHRFAAALLMPKLGVLASFSRRGWSPSAPKPEHAFVVAQHLGVGYTTLVSHLERTLGCLPATTATQLRKVALPSLRSQVAGFPIERDLIVADEQWGNHPLETEVGDVVLVPARARFAGKCATLLHTPKGHLLASAPGTGTLVLNEALPPLAVRVSRRGFVGLARYRHLEESPDVE